MNPDKAMAILKESMGKLPMDSIQEQDLKRQARNALRYIENWCMPQTMKL